jgi:addiction module HigA family antidote
MPTVSFDDWEAEQLRDPAVKAAYDALEPEYKQACERIEAEIAARKERMEGYATGKLAPVHPGEVLQKEFLEPAGMSQRALGRLLGVNATTINMFCRGTVRVSPELALRLARYWGTSARFWLDIQTCYDLERARDAVGARVDAEVTPGMGTETGEWKEELPFTDWE